MPKKDGDSAVDMLLQKIDHTTNRATLGWFTVGVSATSLIVYAEHPARFAGVLPKTCGGWKIEVKKSAQPRPA